MIHYTKYRQIPSKLEFSRLSLRVYINYVTTFIIHIGQTEEPNSYESSQIGININT